MNDKFLKSSTAPLLRVLADQIERDCPPDFMIVVQCEGGFSTAHYSSEDIFGLMGAIKWRSDVISQEVES